MYWEPHISMGEVDVTDDEQTAACLGLWAAKFLTHQKDYEHKDLRRLPLPVNVSPTEYRLAKPTDQAEFWFFIEQRKGTGTFEWVCSLFGFEPDRVRSKIQPRWRELYGNQVKPLGLEAAGKKALQVVPHATPVAKTDRELAIHE
jgi:hypothetical protein